MRTETKIWRRDPESNWARRICNPLHNRFAIAPKNANDKTRKFVLSKEQVRSLKMERETRLELATSTLARLRSTN